MKPSRLFLSSLVCLAVTGQAPVLSASNQREGFCNKSGAKFDIREADCKGSIEKIRAEEKKPKPLEAPKYPVKTGFLMMADKSTGSQTAFYFTSTDGSTLNLNFPKDNPPPLSLKVSDIVSWKSGVAGQGSDSSAAISTVVAGALFFWPMILAAPFMVKNYTITGFEVLYIDDYGSDVPLIFATTESPIPVLSLLKFSTGLEPGESRGSNITKPLYESGLAKSLERLKSQKEKILVKNSKKPWCSSVDLSKKTEDVVAYEKSIVHINKLRQKLGMAEFSDQSAKSSDEQWDTYLASNKGLGAWAKSFPKQAELLRACSK